VASACSCRTDDREPPIGMINATQFPGCALANSLGSNMSCI
jgi:hypothetical protein